MRSGQGSGFEQQLNLREEVGTSWWKTKIYKGAPSHKIYHFVEAPKQDYNTSPSQVTPSRAMGGPRLHLTNPGGEGIVSSSIFIHPNL